MKLCKITACNLFQTTQKIFSKSKFKFLERANVFNTKKKRTPGRTLPYWFGSVMIKIWRKKLCAGTVRYRTVPHVRKWYHTYVSAYHTVAIFLNRKQKCTFTWKYITFGDARIYCIDFYYRSLFSLSHLLLVYFTNRRRNYVLEPIPQKMRFVCRQRGFLLRKKFVRIENNKITEKWDKEYRYLCHIRLL